MRGLVMDADLRLVFGDDCQKVIRILQPQPHMAEAALALGKAAVSADDLPRYLDAVKHCTDVLRISDEDWRASIDVADYVAYVCGLTQCLPEMVQSVLRVSRRLVRDYS